MSDDAPPDGFQPREWVTWIRQSNHTAIKLLRETASSALLVLLIGLVLFGASGVGRRWSRSRAGAWNHTWSAAT